ncbi:MAG: HPF/RaiA family ribosome-associated protein [Patescibacteria group bacterium]|nr:HPF/RaiA family ribosome-associated protein [Patescibacteria group bacterium]MDD5121098.1 HPF/RaiA family ribosome-associated protein [Patescibacteria group bacterium]MDD5221930.1 HPF/RaiA family ribosome-associated protein [Patescibacteria group bacterium]MDD5395983.1 HPF/RaiA family ribosome-associated protein [Patescibacteria group bacterium]
MERINYFIKHINLIGQIKDSFEEKIEKLIHLAPESKEINVDLKYHPVRAKEESTQLEVCLIMTKRKIMASAMASNILEAADIVVAKIKKQLEKNKQKREVKKKITRRVIRESKSI